VTSKAAKQQLFTGLGLYALVIASLSLWWEQSLLLFGLLAGLSVITLLRFRSRRSVAFYLVGAILGPLAESFPIASGAWSYAATGTLFPIWLPPAWGLACLLMVVIVEGVLPPSSNSPPPQS